MANPLSDDPFVIVTEKKIKSSPLGKLFNKIKPPYSNFANRNVMAMAVVLLLVGTIGAGVLYLGNHTQLKPKANESGVEVSISPASLNVAPTQTFQVYIKVDTKGQQITGAQIKVNYDSSRMTLTNTQLNNFLPKVLSPPENTEGSTSFTLASNPDAPKEGVNTLATLSFTAKSCPALSCVGTIGLDSNETQIASLSQDTNAVGNLLASTITIGDALEQSPKPSTSPTSLKEPYYKLEKGTESNGQIPVKIFARTQTDAVNLFVVKLNFGSNLSVLRFDNTGSVVTNWATQSSDTLNHTIAIAGGIPNPGIKSAADGGDLLITTVVFNGTASTLQDISFLTDSSMYRNFDNEDILSSSLDLAGRIVSYTGANPSSSPTTPHETQGDGNGDGVVNYQDLSVLLSNWTRVGVTRSIPPGIDFNGDEKINNFDYASMTNLLVQLGIIHRNS